MLANIPPQTAASATVFPGSTSVIRLGKTGIIIPIPTESRITVKTIIFIGNKEGNEKYVSNLEKLSNTLGLSNYIKILGNFENMPLAYHISDIILYPSIIPEPFGRVPIEAQAAGKIIIASNNGGMTETIKEGEDNTGFRIKNNDVEDLKNKINLSLNLNDDEISNLRKRAIEYVDKNFSLENMCKKTLDVYDRILNVSKK